MALVYDSRWRSIDANGNPYSGAQLTIYLANTTTPAAIFRDAALAVPMSNPTIGADAADSAGRFPQIYAADGAIFDILEKTSGGALITSYEDVGVLGASSVTLERDFTNSRFKVSGSGGVVSIEAGDPSPDNVGGKARLGGWNGTQADTISLDGAAVDVTGYLTERSKKLLGVVETEATTFAAASTVSIALPNVPTGVRRWAVEFFDVTRSAATVVTLTVQLSFDGGATWKSTNEYDTESFGRDNTGTFPSESVSSGVGAGALANGIRGSSNKLIWGVMDILGPLAAGSSDATIIRSHVVGMNQEGTNRATQFFGVTLCQGASFGRPTNVRIVCNTGNIDGKYRVTPLRGFGE